MYEELDVELQQQVEEYLAEVWGGGWAGGWCGVVWGGGMRCGEARLGTERCAAVSPSTNSNACPS